jgi:hypothetical protein
MPASDEATQELITALSRDHAILVVRVEHHDSRISDLIEEQQWLRRLIITSMFIVVMTLVSTVLGFLAAAGG